MVAGAEAYWSLKHAQHADLDEGERRRALRALVLVLGADARVKGTEAAVEAKVLEQAGSQARRVRGSWR